MILQSNMKNQEIYKKLNNYLSKNDIYNLTYIYNAASKRIKL